MAKAPRATAEQVLRALRRDRWEERKTSATSHRHLTHPVKPGVVVVPYHRGAIIKPKTLQSIVRAAGLSMDQFRELL